ncbi:MAG: ABC transporter ATP-binding protein [Planctomycetes bacterium]|nr:ABC transporter ATP-binding protein [Planctomycetota bacterium]
MTAMITIRDLVLRHGRTRAVDGLDLEVEPGTVTALLGRNGAGKSTLLDGVIGLMPPDRGTIRVFGLDPWKKGPEVRRAIGYVEADPWFEPGERVRDLMRFHRALHPRWSEAEAERLLADFELDPARKVRQLSRGTRTKLALLLALAHAPRLLVLDEPFDGLDCGVRDEILAEVVRQVDDERAIIVASHDLDEVERVADRVLVLHQGKLAFAGELETLKEGTRRYLGRAHEDFRLEDVPGAVSVERLGRELLITYVGEIDATELAIRGVDDLRLLPPADLEESFLAITGGRRNKEAV